MRREGTSNPAVSVRGGPLIDAWGGCSPPLPLVVLAGGGGPPASPPPLRGGGGGDNVSGRFWGVGGHVIKKIFFFNYINFSIYF